MVYSSVDIRKCIYTNSEAKAKDNVLPRDFLGEDDLHNWANKAPINKDYKEIKQGSEPTELEMQANELFHLLELSRLRVKYYEKRLEQVQSEIKDALVKSAQKAKPKKPKKTKKDKEIEIAIKEKEAVEITEKAAESLVEKRKKLWD